jgi:hypothetical protein
MSIAPDVTSVGIATCADLPNLDREARLLCDTLRRHGVDAVPVIWSEDRSWEGFEAVLLRTTHDCYYSHEPFLAWARRLGARLFNAPPMVEWNINKHYLLDLEANAIPIVATQYVAPGERFDLPHGQFVVKPAIAEGANNSATYDQSLGTDALEHIRSLHDDGRAVLLQPYYHLINEEAETATVFIDGEVSHCMRKEPLLHLGQPPQPSLQETMSIRREQPDVVALAQRTHDLIARRFGRPLYARVDTLRDDHGQPAVLEVELIEPRLFLDFVAGSADQLAAAFIQRVHSTRSDALLNETDKNTRVGNGVRRRKSSRLTKTATRLHP